MMAIVKAVRVNFPRVIDYYAWSYEFEYVQRRSCLFCYSDGGGNFIAMAAES